MVKLTKKNPEVPKEIQGPVRMAFEAQARRDYFDKAFSESKKIISEYFDENSFEVSDKSSSMQTEWGRITATTRKNPTVDKEKLLELIESGRITAISVLNLVSTFKVEDLVAVLGAAASEIITESPSTYLTFSGKPDFKESVQTEMAVLVGKEIPEVEVKPKIEKPKPIPMPVKSTVDVDSELESLLESMSGKVAPKTKKTKGKK